MCSFRRPSKARASCNAIMERATNRLVSAQKFTPAGSRFADSRCAPRPCFLREGSQARQSEPILSLDATNVCQGVFTQIVAVRRPAFYGRCDGHQGMTEPDLAQRLAIDLDGSFEALVVALQGPVYRFAYRWCGNAQDAEEIAQDAFVRAYGALRGYDVERIRALKLTPWLLTIAVNVARNRVRGKRLPIEDLNGVDEPAADRLDEPERISERR